MSAVTTKTEEIVRALGLKDDWRVQQLEIGEVIHLLPFPEYGDGGSVYTKIKASRDAVVVREGDDRRLLVIRGDRAQPRRADVISGATHVIIYNVHTPSDAKKKPYNKLAWLFIGQLADADALMADYHEIFG
jgi:hypothetical protein